MLAQEIEHHGTAVDVQLVVTVVPEPVLDLVDESCECAEHHELISVQAQSFVLLQVGSPIGFRARRLLIARSQC